MGSTFSLAVTPTVNVPVGRDTRVTVGTSITNGSSQPVSLSTSGLPNGVTATFGQNSIAAGTSTYLNLSAAPDLALGSYAFTVTATGSISTRTANATLVVGPSNDFSFGTINTSVTVHSGASVTVTIPTKITAGVTQPVTLSVSGLRDGVTGTFTVNPLASGRSTSLVLHTAGAPVENLVVTVSGSAGLASHSVDFTLVIQPATDFSVSLAASRVQVAAGAKANLSVRTTTLWGSAQLVNLSVSGAPIGCSAAFASSQVRSGSGTTLTLTLAGTTNPGTWGFTVIGVGADTGITHVFSVTLVVTPGKQGSSSRR